MVSKSMRDRSRRPGRKNATREARKRILVICEGEVTEPEYLKQFKVWQRNPLVAVEIAKEHGVPRTLVDIAKRMKEEAELAAHTERDENLLYDEVWCVPDVDQHPRIHEARQKARDNGISLAVSNPCFELWLLLHFRDSPGARPHHDVQDLMRQHVPGFEKHVDFKLFRDGYEQARRRATQLIKHAEEDGDPHRNPTTRVHLLTESISGQSGTAAGPGK